MALLLSRLLRLSLPNNTHSSNMTYNEFIISKNYLKPSYTKSEKISILLKLNQIRKIFYENIKIKDEEIKIRLMEKLNITEEEYNKIDEELLKINLRKSEGKIIKENFELFIDIDLLENKLRKVKNELKKEKFELFMEANKHIPIDEVYEELQKKYKN